MSKKENLISAANFISNMISFSRILLWTLPDKEPSEREDFVRVRQADSIGENLVTDYPLWLSGLVNVWLLKTSQPDEGLIVCFALVSYFIISLMCSTIISIIIRHYVCSKIGFITCNSYDRNIPANFVQQRWPGNQKNLDWIEERNKQIGGIVVDWTWHKDSPVYVKAKRMHQEHSDYWRRQKNAWTGLQIKTNFIGMFVMITSCLIFMVRVF